MFPQTHCKTAETRSLVVAIIDLVDLIKQGNKTRLIVSKAIVMGVMALGTYGSYISHRTYLWVFAIILLIATIVEAVGIESVLGVSFNVVLIVLAIVQAEM